MKTLSGIASMVLACLAVVSFPSAQDSQNGPFRLRSTTFEDNSVMPISTIFDYEYNGVNVCSINGAPGGDESPELAWSNVPPRTRSFAVTTFDVTAGVVHWGMYNVSPTTTELPENAGITGSTYGLQVINTYGSAGSNADMNYGGPCPPSDYPPNVHEYVFTVYALDRDLQLPSSTDFPPTALTLYRALVIAGQEGHVLANASITGLYSTTPPQ
jgi:hypothetical protein